ncbi:MAG: hypothetical protein WCO04_10170 [Pseudomonadota bacterium]
MTFLRYQAKTTSEKSVKRNTAIMIVSPCSSRKKAPIEASLHASNLTAGALSDVALQWKMSVESAAKSNTTQTLYGGRAFSDASWSAKSIGTVHYVVSAGLGLIGPDDKIPSYAMTTVGLTDENVLKKCPAGTTPADWWNKAFPQGIITDLIGKATERVFVALPSVYLEMIQEELLHLSSKDFEKVRILTGGSETLRDTPLGESILPYDLRLDGPDSPIPGTMSDFASRALRHFVGIASKASYQGLSSDKRLVSSALAGMRLPTMPKRVRASDIEIRKALIASWEHTQGNRHKLLRHLRDVLLVSCEQSRFARIARELEEERLV